MLLMSLMGYGMGPHWCPQPASDAGPSYLQWVHLLCLAHAAPNTSLYWNFHWSVLQNWVKSTSLPLQTPLEYLVVCTTEWQFLLCPRECPALLIVEIVSRNNCTSPWWRLVLNLHSIFPVASQTLSPCDRCTFPQCLYITVLTSLILLTYKAFLIVSFGHFQIWDLEWFWFMYTTI